MNSLAKSSLFVALTVAGALVCAGQQAGRAGSKSSGKQKPSPTPQVAVVLDAGPEKKVGEARVGYTKAIDEIGAHTLLALMNENTDWLEVNVGFGNKGTELKRPDKIGFQFTNYDKAKFFKNYSVTFVTEQGSYELLNVRNEIFKDDVGRRQYIYGQLDLETFEKIAASKEVEIKVNKLVFGLRPIHIKSFQDLLRTLE